jgi:glycosyltransferase involved in cell wall biosynthesis
MSEVVDLLIINNAPAFYKVNLYNEVNKYCRIHVIFVGFTKEVVIAPDFTKNIEFSYEILTRKELTSRNKIIVLYRLLKAVGRIKFTKIIYGGYSEIEVALLTLVYPKYKNVLQFETSIKETKLNGIIGYTKKMFFKRFSTVLTSGKLQSDVFRYLGYKGSIIETKGVGVFYKERNGVVRLSKSRTLQYVYVGRLIEIKNLSFVIDVFNQLDKPLTIVGTGILDSELKKMANENISFTGFIDNNKIHEIYKEHDVFILPSIAEPWGLVVEEAIFNGLPVLISDRVGCQLEMVIHPETGLVFDPYSKDDLILKMKMIEENINFYKQSANMFDFNERDRYQVSVYTDLV